MEVLAIIDRVNKERSTIPTFMTLHTCLSAIISDFPIGSSLRSTISVLR